MTSNKSPPKIKKAIDKLIKIWYNKNNNKNKGEMKNGK